MDFPAFNLHNFITGALIAMGSALVLALLLLLLTYRRLKRIRIPAQADFFTTLRHVPLVLVIILDLLDFGLDFLGAPVGWVILSHLGLENLRGVTLVEGLIPGTQPIPTLTIAWILAKIGVRIPPGILSSER
ncbi:MAG: hypothetical protein U9Q70_03230 [Chloroflexota bacterium]|nr:hypothetical protein [Chloroflexota bacterium]